MKGKEITLTLFDLRNSSVCARSARWNCRI